jgi:hypothetical protein
MKKPANDCEWNPELFRMSLPHERHAQAAFYLYGRDRKYKVCEKCANSKIFFAIKKRRINF